MVVMEIKEKYPHIQRITYLWKQETERACYVERTYWMVDDSNYAHFFLNKKRGGVALTYNYAKETPVILFMIYVI